MSAVIFTKQRGHWKFYAFMSSDEMLRGELQHLKDQDVEAMSQPVQRFDIDQIRELESTLNETAKQRIIKQ